jgi:hypothetical protein
MMGQQSRRNMTAQTPSWATLQVSVSDTAVLCCGPTVWLLQDLEYDNLNNPVNFINKYIVLPKNFTSQDTLSFILDKDELDEGESTGDEGLLIT